jgi:hypothetical protein
MRLLTPGRFYWVIGDVWTGIADTLRDMEDIAVLCEAKTPAKRGPYMKQVT